MIDSVPQWKPAAIAAAGVHGAGFRAARRAALSAVIFGSNFGANTACIGSLGGLMMRRLAAMQGVVVTNGMLLRQGHPPRSGIRPLCPQLALERTRTQLYSTASAGVAVFAALRIHAVL